MTPEETKNLAEKKKELKKELKELIGNAVGGIRGRLAELQADIKECGGEDAVEEMLVALDCTFDQFDSALKSWN